jgi:hypothetical protein
MSTARYVTLFATILIACAAASEIEAVGIGSHLETTDASVCTANTQAQVWARAEALPVTPTSAAGLDVSNGGKWDGLPRAVVESALCAGTVLVGDEGDGTNLVGYGDPKNPFLIVSFDTTATRIVSVELFAPYAAGYDFKSRDGAHTYAIKIGSVMKDGEAFTADWSDHATPTEIADAMVATFAPQLPPITADCVDNRCLSRSLEAPNTPPSYIFGARDLGLYFTMTVGNPGPDYLYMFPHKAG